MKAIKFIVALSLFLAFNSNAMAQKIYNPHANAREDIKTALANAKKEGKHVLIQVGGNWCPWCIKMHKYLNNQEEINKLLNEVV
jgi:thioredoxin-related protein